MTTQALLFTCLVRDVVLCHCSLVWCSYSCRSGTSTNYLVLAQQLFGLAIYFLIPVLPFPQTVFYGFFLGCSFHDSCKESLASGSWVTPQSPFSKLGFLLYLCLWPMMYPFPVVSPPSLLMLGNGENIANIGVVCGSSYFFVRVQLVYSLYFGYYLICE